MAEEGIQRRLVAILATDVVGYSRLIEAGEAGTVARLKTLKTELIHPRFAKDGGRIVKTMGDGDLGRSGRSPTSISPPGKNARLQGSSRPRTFAARRSGSGTRAFSRCSNVLTSTVANREIPDQRAYCRRPRSPRSMAANSAGLRRRQYRETR